MRRAVRRQDRARFRWRVQTVSRDRAHARV